ncbi:hypothetical protein ABT316_13270 [Streptomyces cellulosae]|uniref:hypothetical protein n=1 Tax=Streptomyces sp. P9-2 TaxID=3423201 RepID=UPI0019A5DF90|nr:hypothetical protein GCM10018771_52160 [Streptomyces cellulosae]
MEQIEVRLSAQQRGTQADHQLERGAFREAQRRTELGMLLVDSVVLTDLVLGLRDARQDLLHAVVRRQVGVAAPAGQPITNSRASSTLEPMIPAVPSESA